jgi:phosphoadenosine phosphosulfate reductase
MEAPDLEALPAREVLAWAVDQHHPRLAAACSFQKEASVILDLLLSVEPQARVFTLDTGVLFPETYETRRRVEEHYGVEVEVYKGISLSRQAAEHGDELWRRDPDACCGLRKVSPLNEALSTVDAWISGLRRDQSPTRAATRKLAWDGAHAVWKLNPIADWTEHDVWRYIVEHDVPYHPLHDLGYASIGCVHCTVPGEGRAGRWSGQGKIECGLHA